jgi:hypothetical protein
VPALRRPDADRGVHHAGGGDRPDPDAPAHARRRRGSAWSAQPALDRRVRRSWRASTTDREHRAPPRTLRFLNAAPRPPAHGSGPFGARGVPASVRRHGATTRRGADRTTRDAGRRAKTPTRAARGLVARREASRHTPTTPIETIVRRRPPLSRNSGIPYVSREAGRDGRGAVSSQIPPSRTR